MKIAKKNLPHQKKYFDKNCKENPTAPKETEFLSVFV